MPRISFIRLRRGPVATFLSGIDLGPVGIAPRRTGDARLGAPVVATGARALYRRPHTTGWKGSKAVSGFRHRKIGSRKKQLYYVDSALS